MDKHQRAQAKTAIATTTNSLHDSTLTELTMLDTASYFSNLKFLAVAGVGLFGDGYLNISIGLGRDMSACAD